MAACTLRAMTTGGADSGHSEERGAKSDAKAPNLLTFDRSSVPGLFVVVDRLEKGIGLPHRFYENLVDDGDDWSFILKVHALMEASLTMLLTERIGGRNVPDFPTLSDALAHLEMSRSHVGKVELASTLGLIGDQDRRLLRFLSELRNTFVHRIENVTLTLQEYIAARDRNQRRNFVNTFSAEPTEHTTRVILSHPRRSIWFFSLLLLMHLRIQFEALQVIRGAPGIDRTEFVREIRELNDDMAGSPNGLMRTRLGARRATSLLKNRTKQAHPVSAWLWA